ncbi:MAG: AAA family ATPase [Candidatus Omnitrophica bacterium]|nr:AAA family ATPase [Candidatus Omnitrophota bacterium]MBU4479222.1 AAA family ATPase [Candidatus Omnitrophota bacterium]MCG2703912.1 AAA family ATPase [Candidatus Omnitrophota bacterium]
MIDLGPLIELDRLAREDGKRYPKRRFLYNDLGIEHGRHFTGIAGPRGAGKTILLKQIALNHPDTFYLSLDTFSDDLFETVKDVHHILKAKLFLLDEVHMRSGFEAGLKKIYDFLDVKVVFTSSMALALYQSAHDLSRRVILKTLYPFSLREYIFFRFDRQVTPVTIDDIVNGCFDRSVMESGQVFSEYIRGGLMPFALNETSPQALLDNILQTVIYKDIARASKITMNELDIIRKLVSFVGKSAIDGINYSSLSRNLGITKYKAEQYTALLERAFILHRVMPQGTGVLKEPKIVMALPYRLLFRTYEECIGGLREDFFVEAARAAGFEISYLKSTRGEKIPDYVLRDKEMFVFEIGGKGKGRQQFKGFKPGRKVILSDGYESEGIKRPLFLFGFLSTARNSV